MKVLVLMLLVVVVSLSGVRRQALGYSDCEDDDIYGLQGHCREAVWVGEAAVEPSSDCCYFVQQRTSLACVCQYVVTRKHEKYISMKKIAHLARYCGVPLQPGTKLQDPAAAMSLPDSVQSQHSVGGRIGLRIWQKLLCDIGDKKRYLTIDMVFKLRNALRSAGGSIGRF
ncbi:hypothetical protein Taro_029014 [Colocasia esculenta]|uniref:Bifunctional inhibitor/plant lipid transfer protein/seed storage helical domain-containing protein n=1 Tax=Colocasia esculenta TaxID=4460 RepID=A0A843VPU9_COLES|nr:hypothetical protein [Colocasia esculenta]